MQGSFIMSTARSGSTLTRFIIDTHPDIYSPGELRLGELARLLYWCIESLDGRYGHYRAPGDEAMTRTRNVIASLLEERTREKGKRMWCEKTPDNLTYLSLLTAIFPDARFICLYRHAMDVAQSCLESSRHGFLPVLEKYVHRSPRNTIVAAIQYWVDGTAALLDLERERPEQTFRLRYEDLVLEPEAVLPPLFEFLGVSWDPSILQKVFTEPHESGEGDEYVRYAGRIHADSIGAGRTLPSRSLDDDLHRRMTALLAELGYEAMPVRPAPVAPESPSADQRETPRWVFETLVADRLSAAGGSLSPLSCTVAVLGEGGGTWSLSIGDGASRVVPGGEAPCRIEIQAADLLDIVHGRANARKSMLEGKIRIRGALSEQSIRDFILLIRTDLERPGLAS